jgi:hypothetical protein
MSTQLQTIWLNTYVAAYIVMPVTMEFLQSDLHKMLRGHVEDWETILDKQQRKKIHVCFCGCTLKY